ncbi:MAG: 50S ribosomal protein L25 [Acidimicrobiia bacterium]|nr:50S ribosomal protein L25 [Acidimicrobiia bacterium]
MDATLEAVKRDTRGKNAARRLRASGGVPAVVYGGATPEGTPVSVDPKALLRILHSDSGANTLINLRLDGGESRVMVREFQLDPVTHALLHADFYALAMDKLIEVTVPVVLTGEAPGVKIQGGMVDFLTREIEVECLPTDIPEQVTVDISQLMLHQSVRVRDLPPAAAWKPATEPETMIVHIVTVKAEESAAAAEATPAAAPEPEVIKKGKPERDAEEGKDKK